MGEEMRFLFHKKGSPWLFPAGAAPCALPGASRAFPGTARPGCVHALFHLQ